MSSGHNHFFAAERYDRGSFDPRLIVFLFVLALGSVVLAAHSLFPLLLVAGCLVLSRCWRLSWHYIKWRLTAPLGMVLVILLTQSLLAGTTPLWQWGAICITQDGLFRGLYLGSKVLAAFSIASVLSALLSLTQLCSVLLWLRLPQEWVEIALLMERYISLLANMTANGFSAQKLRLGYSSWRTACQSAGALTGAVLVRSFDQAVRTQEAMNLRGYAGQQIFPAPSKMPRAQLWQTAFVGLGLLACFLIFDSEGFLWWAKSWWK